MREREKKKENSGEKMVALPEVYARRRLNVLYREIPIKETTARLLRKYCNAMAHLYGLIPLHKAWEIIHSQNLKLMEKDQFVAFAEVARHESEDFYILGDDEIYAGRKPGSRLNRRIIDAALLEGTGDGLAGIDAAQRTKPYFVPEKAQLLAYSDRDYYEPTPQAAQLQEFVEKRLHLGPEAAQQAFHSLLFSARSQLWEPQDLLGKLKRLGAKFSAAAPMQRFLNLYQDFANNTRMACHRGYTPEEILSLAAGALQEDEEDNIG